MLSSAFAAVDIVDNIVERDPYVPPQGVERVGCVTVVRAVLSRHISAVGLEGLVRGRSGNTIGMKSKQVAESAWRHGECDEIDDLS